MPEVNEEVMDTEADNTDTQAGFDEAIQDESIEKQDETVDKVVEPVKDDKGEETPAAKAGSKAKEAEDDDGAPPPLDDRAKAAEESARVAEYWKTVREAHPDADDVLSSDWIKAYYSKATPAERERLVQDAPAEELAKGIAAAKEWKQKQDAAADNEGKPIFELFKDLEITTRSGETKKAGDMVAEFGEDSADFIDLIGGIVGSVKKENAELRSKLEAMESSVQQTTGTVSDMQFWSSVRSEHADVDALRASGKIDEFVKAKGAGWEKLYAEGTDKDVKDVITAYKKEIEAVESTTDKAKATARAKRDARAELDKSLLGSGKRKQGGGGEALPEDEMKAGFDEAINGD